MSADREWYDSVYGGFADELNAAIRSEAFGEEIGQNSWLTADEHRSFFHMLGLDSSTDVLEVASGSGGPALFMVRETGCRVTGVDLHDDGVATANAAAATAGLADRARFQRVDARAGLPFEEASSTRSSASTRSTTCTSARRWCATGTGCCGRAGGCSSPIRSS